MTFAGLAAVTLGAVELPAQQSREAVTPPKGVPPDALSKLGTARGRGRTMTVFGSGPAEPLPGNVRPVYPPLLERSVAGAVSLHFFIDSLGRPRTRPVEVTGSPHPMLTEAVLAALPRMRFRVQPSSPRRTELQAVWHSWHTLRDFQMYRDAEPLPDTPPPTSPSGLTVPGEVVVEFVVDTLGRPEMNQVRFLASSDARLTEAVMAALLRMRFRPAEAVPGLKVRQLVERAFTFNPR
jgi:TonB family protein